MKNMWTSDDLKKILVQLDSQMLPFKKYCFSDLGKGLHMMGSGGYAYVYEAQARESPNQKYAIKVIGFKNRRIDSREFRKAVEAQKKLCLMQNNVVKVYSAVELRVWLDLDNIVLKVEEVKADYINIPEGDFLDLQFIVMEKLSSVMIEDRLGRPKLFPNALAEFDEREILKLSYDIGLALVASHEQHILHRDIKIENIFYDSKKKCYKLGDFGISKETEDGMASTIAFTKGYGAPEVVSAMGEKYDNTADIYSFGILLYVLMNRLRFPGSQNYSANVREQYDFGYRLPMLDRGDMELSLLLIKMCSFHPDARPQTMEEVLNEIDGIIIHEGAKYKRRHRKLSMVMVGIFALATYIMWAKIRWVAITSLSLAAFFWLEYTALNDRNLRKEAVYFKRNWHWIFAMIMYFVLIIYDWVLHQEDMMLLEKFWGEAIIEKLATFELTKIGILGFLFCVMWYVREKMMVTFRRKQKIKI